MREVRQVVLVQLLKLDLQAVQLLRNILRQRLQSLVLFLILDSFGMDLREPKRELRKKLAHIAILCGRVQAWIRHLLGVPLDLFLKLLDNQADLFEVELDLVVAVGELEHCLLKVAHRVLVLKLELLKSLLNHFVLAAPVRLVRGACLVDGLGQLCERCFDVPFC